MFLNIEVDHNLLILLNGFECPDLLPLGYQAARLEVFLEPAPNSVGKAGVVDARDVIVQSTLSLVESGILGERVNDLF